MFATTFNFLSLNLSSYLDNNRFFPGKWQP